MNDVVNEIIKIEKIVEERIEENQKLFNEEELKIIKNNVNIIKKVYLIGLLNGRQIYGK